MNTKTKTKNTPATPVKCLCASCGGGGFALTDAGQSSGVYCAICHGQGAILRPVAETKLCPECNGAAKIESLENCADCHGIGKHYSGPHVILCTPCGAKGKLPLSEPCLACAATGRVPLDPSAPIKPPRVDNSVKAWLARAELRLAEIEKRINPTATR